jgi:inosose dehydratase
LEPEVLKAEAMRRLLVGNAPCSWGTLEFEKAKGEQIPYVQMLDELVETGYTGTELGDWGYMPTDPALLRAALENRGLSLLGAFVPITLKDAGAHRAGVARALKTARLLADAAGTSRPFLILADNNGTDARRTQLAGRIAEADGLNAAEWKVFATGADMVACAVFEETGLRTVFHHHCAGYVETPPEIGKLLELTDAARLGLVFDTGHYVYGSGGEADAAEGLESFGERVWYVHLKDCQPEVARRARAEQWDYFTALRHGVFCELGTGSLGFSAVLKRLRARGYDGYVLVEQDVLPGMGEPKESAARNRAYLRSIENDFA